MNTVSFRCRVSRGKCAARALLWDVFIVTMAVGILLAMSAIRAQAGPTGPGFIVNPADLRFIFKQIEISENHAAQTRVPGNAPIARRS